MTQPMDDLMPEAEKTLKAYVDAFGPDEAAAFDHVGWRTLHTAIVEHLQFTDQLREYAKKAVEAEKRKPLTGDQIKATLALCRNGSIYEIVRAIEAAHGITLD